MANLARKAGIKQQKMPKVIHYVLISLRYLLLAVLLLILADFIIILLGYDPRANLLNYMGGYKLSFAGILVILAFLLISTVYERAFCSYLCVEGAKMGIFGALRPVTIIKNAETCIRCSICNNVCPMNIDVLGYEQVRSLQCIKCMECVAACPKNGALKFALMPRKESMQKILLVLATCSALSGLAYFIHDLNATAPMPTASATYSSFELPPAPVETEPVEGVAAEQYGNAAGIADGIYEGSAVGFRGTMTVEVTVESQRISRIEMKYTNDDWRWLQMAYAVIPRILEKQSPDVDSVTGATYTAVGIKKAVANALVNAGGTYVDAVNDTLPVRSRGRRGGRRSFR